MFIEEDEVVENASPPAPAATQEKEDLRTRYYEVELPSKGKLGYDQFVKYRDILVRDEKILSTATAANYSRVLNDILKSLLKDDSRYDELTISDRDFLLMWIWANNYSPIRKFDVSCQECGTTENKEIDLTKIDVTEISDEYVHPFKMSLSNGNEVSLRLMTVADEKAAQSFVKRNKEYDVLSVMFALTIELGRVMPLQQKLDYIEENLTGRDMSLVRAFHRHFRYGVEDTAEHQCSACSEVTRFEIPFSIDIFMPTLSDDFEKMLRSNQTSRD